jgi:DNA-binding transcriptional ArsR family regulator/predicted transcriptional regulator
MATRAEYLSGSLSRLQPWLAQGISRRQWERRRRKVAGLTDVPTKGDFAGNIRNPASNVPPMESAGEISQAPTRQRALRRRDEDLLMRSIHAYWDAQGMTHSDPQALPKAIHAIMLPERLKCMDKWALIKVYRRARERFPAGYDRWIGLIEKWDRAYSRQNARDLVDNLITALADRPPRIVDHMFRHLDRQICDHFPKKVRRLEYECERLKSDEWYFPDFRPLKTDAFKEQVYAALADGPKTKKQLARMFGKTPGAISSAGLRLRNEGLITSIWRDGQFMWARPATDTQFIAARDAIIEALKKGPMTVSALARATGKGIPTIKSALHRHLLTNRTVIRTKFGVYALAGTQSPYVSRGDAIVAALGEGPLSFQALAREINSPSSSVPQFLEPLLAKGKVIRIKRGIYALNGTGPAYIPTSDAIVSALKKRPMKLGPLVQHVIALTKSTRSRSSIRTVLSRLKKQGTVKQERQWGEYRLVRRMRSVRRGESAQRKASDKARRR